MFHQFKCITKFIFKLHCYIKMKTNLLLQALNVYELIKLEKTPENNPADQAAKT
jgi:hypothetical protein